MCRLRARISNARWRTSLARWAPSLDPLEDAHVIRDCRATHVEDAGERRALHLHVTGSFGELHGAERVHGDTGGADRMALGLEPAGRIDRQLAVLLGQPFRDGAG